MKHKSLERFLWEKDVDGFHPISIGQMILNEEGFVPCTPAGIQELLIRSGYSPVNKHVVILDAAVS